MLLLPAVAEACATCIASPFGDRTYNWPYLGLILLPFAVAAVIGGVLARVSGDEPVRPCAVARAASPSGGTTRGDDMSQAAIHAVEPAETPLTPESWGKLGMWIFLAGDAVGFGVLLAGYGIMRATSADWPNPYDALGINLTAAMTFLLICSSVTMVKALEWLGKGDRRRADQLPDLHGARRD